MTRLDIFSDPVCPWCYIGKANLDRALESHPEHPFIIEWHPFQLNPAMPAGGTSRADYLEKLFGNRMKAAEAHVRLEEIGHKAGVQFDFAAMQRIPNTLDAHRLIHWAGLEGRQNAIVTALFRANFREGRDIGDAATLAEIAGKSGMDAAMVARLLATDADRDDILARDLDARKKGVNAVPTFLIAQQYAVSGAQSPDLWAKIIADLAQQADT